MLIGRMVVSIDVKLNVEHISGSRAERSSDIGGGYLPKRSYMIKKMPTLA
jgi:hypothetical protein